SRLPKTTSPIVIANSALKPCHAEMGKSPAAKSKAGKTLPMAGKMMYLPTTFGKKKMPRIKRVRITGDKSMPFGGSSCFLVIVLTIYTPKKVLKTMIRQKTNVNKLAVQATTGKRKPQVTSEKISSWEIFKTDMKNISLLKKPLNGGSPAMEKLPAMATVNDIGIKAINPPRRRISLVPICKSIMPTTMNSAPLNVEWLTR